jgi:small subunit ribosomal protein S35
LGDATPIQYVARSGLKDGADVDFTPEFAKPFVPPTVDMPLRFRYTTYLGEQHPAEKKVVVEFCTVDMPDLNITQRSKLIKIAGVRYNPETDIIKMSCEMFPSQAQNKRYLGDLINDMLREARVCEFPDSHSVILTLLGYDGHI